MSRIEELEPLAFAPAPRRPRTFAIFLWAPREISIRPAFALVGVGAGRSSGCPTRARRLPDRAGGDSGGAVRMCSCSSASRPRHARAAGGQLHQLGAALRAAAVRSRRLDDHRSADAGRSRLRVCRRRPASGCPTRTRRRSATGLAGRTAVSRCCPPIRRNCDESAVTAALVVILVALSHATAARGQGWSADVSAGRLVYDPRVGKRRHQQPDRQPPVRHASRDAGSMAPALCPLAMSGTFWGAAGTGGRVIFSAPQRWPGECRGGCRRSRVFVPRSRGRSGRNRRHARSDAVRAAGRRARDSSKVAAGGADTRCRSRAFARIARVFETGRAAGYGATLRVRGRCAVGACERRNISVRRRHGRVRRRRA